MNKFISENVEEIEEIHEVHYYYYLRRLFRQNPTMMGSTAISKTFKHVHNVIRTGETEERFW